jgi:hypothetical protein
MKKFLLFLIVIFIIKNKKELKNNNLISLSEEKEEENEFCLELIEKNNLLYIPVYIDNITYNLQIDTNLEYSWLPSIDLMSNINNSLFNITTFYQNKNINYSSINNDSFVIINSKNGYIQGILTYDNININNQIDLKELFFYSIFKFDKFYNGYPNGKLSLGYSENENNGLISILFNKSFIDSKKFLLINKKIYFDIPKEFKNYPFSFCNLTNSLIFIEEFKNSWVCSLSHIILGDINKDFDDGFQIYPSYVVFDISSEFILIPKSFFNIFENNLFKIYLKNICVKNSNENNEIYFTCKTNEKFNFIHITFIFDGFGYVLSLKQLMKKIDNYEEILLIKFYENSENIFILGTPFIKQYMMEYNYENKIIGFIGGEREDFTAEWGLWKKNINFNKKQERLMLFIVGCVVLVMMFIVVISFEIWNLKIKKNKESKRIEGLMLNENINDILE